jgi:transcriptional regulator with XRE-family HTH domain
MPLTRELDPGASPLAFFGAELRRARTAARLSQDQLGQHIGYSAALVGKVETGERAPTQDFANRCDQALPTADSLFSRIYLLIQRWDGSYPSWFAEWVEAERRAKSLCWWEALLVPGLVQTADYARSLFAAWRSADDGDELDQLVNGRMERQLIFDRPDSPSLWVIIDEGGCVAVSAVRRSCMTSSRSWRT